MSLRQFSVTVVLALVTVLPYQAAEQYPARILRSISRSADFHPVNAAVFQFDVLQAIGGVLSQTNRLVTDKGEYGVFSVSVNVEDGKYPGYITVHHMETHTPYSIDYTDLVPMALFVDSGGTSLYTVWDGLPQKFLSPAGFLAHHIDGELALEFSDTRYADALYFLDLCDECLAAQEISVADDLATTLWKSSDRALGSSYINTDVRLPFRFTVVAGQGSIAGRIARFDWSTTKATSTISARPVLPEPERSAHSFLTAFPDFDQLDALNSDAIEQAADAARTWDDTRRRLLDQGFFLFETLALLRTAKTHAPEEWSTFMEVLSSEELVSASPSSWDRYTRSVCIVYPSEPECLN